MCIKAVIFDLDGVIVSTDNFHYQAWKRMSDEEGIPFDRETNQKLRGVSRMASLEIILEKSSRVYTDKEKEKLAASKNKFYTEKLADLTADDILPGVKNLLASLRQQKIKIAVGSSSKNAPYILERIGMQDYFDAVADGNQISHSKPDPEVFLLAAKLLGNPPENCAVVEDAYAGIEAAKAGGMFAVGVGFAQTCPQADLAAPDLDHVELKSIMNLKK